MPYKDKTIWITGASSGIGRQIAVELAARGARLILSSRDKKKLEQVESSLANSGRHLILDCDLTDTDALRGIVDKAIQFTGKIDYLFNNAGISQRSLSLGTVDNVEQHIMTLDFWAPVRLSKLLLPLMIERGEGIIVNIASMTAKIGSPGRSIYTAAKHALIGYMDCLRAEVSTKGIRIVNVCPGFVRTNISINALKGDASLFDKLDDEIKHGMAVTPFVNKLLKKLPHKNEIIIAQGLPLYGYWLYKFSPAAFHKILEKVYKKQAWQQ